MSCVPWNISMGGSPDRSPKSGLRCGDLGLSPPAHHHPASRSPGSASIASSFSAAAAPGLDIVMSSHGEKRMRRPGGVSPRSR